MGDERGAARSAAAAHARADGRLRILVVADELEPHGGAERSQVDVAQELARRGHEIHVLYARPGAFLQRYQSFARTLTRVPATQGDGRRRTDLGLLAGAVPALLAARAVDVVYANSIRLTFLAGLVGRLRRLPVVCHLRLPDAPGMSVKNRLGLSAVTAFIAVSQHTRARHVAQGLAADRIVVVHNGIDPEQFPLQDSAARAHARAELGLPDESFVVLYAGRLDRAKGVETLLAAWTTSSAGDVLLVAGAPREHLSPDDAGRYVAGLHAAAAAHDVRWLGRRLDVVPLYAAADVVVLPSLFPEPFGRVVLEALACGRPVVATTVGGVPEILGEAFPELLVPPGDAGALRAALERLRTEHDDDRPARLRRHVQESFSLTSTADGVERVLRTAVTRTP